MLTIGLAWAWLCDLCWLRVDLLTIRGLVDHWWLVDFMVWCWECDYILTIIGGSLSVDSLSLYVNSCHYERNGIWLTWRSTDWLDIYRRPLSCAYGYILSVGELSFKNIKFNMEINDHRDQRLWMVYDFFEDFLSLTNAFKRCNKEESIH